MKGFKNFHHQNDKKCAFTLAEVLITLGVIGVVAAITLAPLVHKYKMKQYETAFKKTNANIQNAINLALQDSGYSRITDIAKLCTGQGWPIAGNCRSESQAELQNFWNQVLLNLKIAKTIIYTDSNQKARNASKFGRITTVRGTASNYYYMGLYGVSYCIAILNDGSSVGCRPALHQHRNGDIYYSFDTNGPAKGPNRIGYDIFIVSNTNQYCTQNSNNGEILYTDLGCYNYALRNQSLNDNAKNYWESLK